MEDPTLPQVRPGSDRVDLLWLPLGAGGHVVRRNGRVYEALVAARERRPRCDLYHAALEVRAGGERYAVEMGPVWGNPEPDRGVVVEGPVGCRLLGRSRAFRYEVRCWRDGVIPDAAEAVDSPRTVTWEPERVRRVLGLIVQVPPLVWGRDEIRAGEMWNSNSMVAWLLVRGGLDPDDPVLAPPPRGRAPGWQAGLVLAARDAAAASYGRN
jgi:hypothetical protein